MLPHRTFTTFTSPKLNVLFIPILSTLCYVSKIAMHKGSFERKSQKINCKLVLVFDAIKNGLINNFPEIEVHI